MQNKNTVPETLELKKDLTRLQEVSASIDRLTERMESENSLTDSSENVIDEQVREQRSIIDKFLNLSDDRESVEKLSEIVAAIEERVDLLTSSGGGQPINELKTEILGLVDEWSNCLETIIKGVVNRAI